MNNNKNTEGTMKTMSHMVDISPIILIITWKVKELNISVIRNHWTGFKKEKQQKIEDRYCYLLKKKNTQIKYKDTKKLKGEDWGIYNM